MVKELDKSQNTLTIDCSICGTEYKHTYKQGEVHEYSEIYGEYENMKLDPCPECGSVVFLNLNLPIESLSEKFFEEMGMPEGERQQRRIIKELITSGEIVLGNS